MQHGASKIVPRVLVKAAGPNHTQTGSKDRRHVHLPAHPLCFLSPNWLFKGRGLSFHLLWVEVCAPPKRYVHALTFVL